MTERVRDEDVSIRSGTVDDVTELISFVAEYCEIEGRAFDHDSTRRALVPLLTDDRHGSVWIIEYGSAPAGYACVTWGYSLEAGGPEALFDELYVRRRGVGIGTTGMALVLDEVRRLGFTRVFLETEAQNSRGRRIYERLGFVVEDSVWMSLDWRPSEPQSS